MALKAYKHLTDGEVKIVEEDSAEEAGLVADVVHGASYIQLQNDGTREEVAAAQGTALWEDVTDELGGGGSSFAHLTEDTALRATFNLFVSGASDRFIEVDSTSGSYAILQAQNAGAQLTLSSQDGNAEKVLTVDLDGDLAIVGVGKIAVQP